ncbi:MAG: hypothetical protein V1808_01860 [Candidatus Daviesbacteria bacterium]
MKKIKQEEERPKKRLLKVIRVTVVLVLVIFFLEIWMMTRLSTYGNKIQELKQTKDAITLENQILENTIAKNSSLNLVEKKASQLGFGSIKNLEYIKPTALAWTQ